MNVALPCSVLVATLLSILPFPSGKGQVFHLTYSKHIPSVQTCWYWQNFAKTVHGLHTLASRVVVSNVLFWKHSIWNVFRLVIILFASLPRLSLAMNRSDIAFGNVSIMDCFYQPAVFPKNTHRLTPITMVVTNCFRKFNTLTSMSATLLGHHY